MLSKKVCCAIMILCELHCTRPDEKMGRKMLLRTTLAESCDVDSRTFRRVMQQLYLNRYITTVKSSVVLTCNPDAITIYDLFVLLHGGIPLGEEQEQKMDAYTESKYQKIAALEEDVRQVSRKYFERKTVASMISGRRIYNNKK